MKKNNIFTRKKSGKVENAAKMNAIHVFGAGMHKRRASGARSANHRRAGKKTMVIKNFLRCEDFIYKNSGIKIDNSRKKCYHINSQTAISLFAFG